MDSSYCMEDFEILVTETKNSGTSFLHYHKDKVPINGHLYMYVDGKCAAEHAQKPIDIQFPSHLRFSSTVQQILNDQH